MGEKPRDKACLSSWRRQAPIAATSIPLTFIGLCGLDGERYEKAATHIVQHQLFNYWGRGRFVNATLHGRGKNLQ